MGEQFSGPNAYRNPDDVDHITRLESDVALWKREAEARSEGMVGLNLDRAAMGVEIMQLRELVERSLAAINAGIAMADAEWRNHDSAVDRNDKIIREYRYDAREALSRISSAPDSGAPADAVQALVSDQAAARLVPAGFDPSRDGWIEWAGGERPVTGDTPVECRLRDGRLMKPARARSRDWSHVYGPNAHLDIIAYRVIAGETPNA